MLRLIVVSGPDAGREASLENGSRIGRGPASGLRLSDRSISRVHASVEERDGTWFLVDEKSTNGVWSRDERVSEVELADGTEVRLGEVVLRAQLEKREASPEIAPAPPAPSPPAKQTAPEQSMQFSSGGGAVVEEEDADIEVEWDDIPEGEAPAPIEVSASARPKPAVRDLQRDELMRGLDKSTGGMASADLSQLPGWIRALLFLGVLLVSGGVFYGVMQLVKGARG